MFWFTKQSICCIINFSISLATNFMSLNNNEPCITRPVLIDLNTLKFNFYPFMISLQSFSFIF